MKYFIVTSDLTPNGGISRYVFSLCSFLSKEKNVYVILTHNNADTHYEEEELRKITPDIKLIALGAKNKPYKYFSALKYIWKIKPDIIINNYNAVFQYLLPYIPSNIKVVHILHNDTADFYRIGSINANKTTGWIAPTIGIAENFNRYTNGRYTDRVTVISHGVESVSQPIKNSNGKAEIIFTGVLYEHKGVKTLPAIIHSLEARNIDFHFTIVGCGILEDWLKDQFKSEISRGVVEMTGTIKHDEVYKRMAKADIFLYPTHLDAFGLVIAESMMNGAIPVVTNLIGVTDNLINNNVNGFLIDQDDIEGFASTIAQLAYDRDTLHKISESAHQRAVTALSIEQMHSNYNSYLNAL